MKILDVSLLQSNIFGKTQISFFGEEATQDLKQELRKVQGHVWLRVSNEILQKSIL